MRRSAAWTVAGRVLLWTASMLTYAAVLLLVFLAVRAAGRLDGDRAWVLGWAGLTGAVVVALAGGLWLATGYDVPAAVLAAHGAYQAAPGSAGRSLLAWRVRVPLVVGLLIGQTLLVQVMFATRW